MATYVASRYDKDGNLVSTVTSDTVAMTVTSIENGITTVTPLDPVIAARIEAAELRDTRERNFYNQIATLESWATDLKALNMSGMTLAQNNTTTQLHMRRIGQVLDRLADLLKEKFD